MALNVHWTAEALDDLDRLYAFLAPVNQPAALRRTIDLLDYVEYIAQHPGLTEPLPQFAPANVRRGGVSQCEVRFEFDSLGMYVLRIFHEREHR